MTTRRVLAALALMSGVAAAIAGGVKPASQEVAQRTGTAHDEIAQLATEIEREEDHVTALELAAWIRDRKPGLRVIDMGEGATIIPRSERMTLQSAVALPVHSNETLVLASDGGAHAAQAWVLLRARGHRNVYFLRGGVREWQEQVLSPAKSTELTRYFRRDGC